MIIDFEFKNHRSFRGEQSFSMRRDHSRANEKPDIKAKGIPEGLVRVAALYGANASGKTGFLTAFKTLRTIVTEGFTDTEKEESTRQSFYLDKDSPSGFNIFFVAENKKYHYSIELDDTKILYELLTVYNSAKPTMLFSRTHGQTQHIKLGSMIKTEKAISIRAVAKNMPSVSLVSIGQKVQEKSIDPVFRFFRDNLKVHDSFTIHGELEALKHRLVKETDLADVLGRMLPAADLGVRSVASIEEGPMLLPGDKDGKRTAKAEGIVRTALRQITKLSNPGVSDADLDKISFSNNRPRRLIFKHGLDDCEFDLGQDLESRGTIAATAFLANLMTILENSRVYIVDEIDCSLHPTLVAQLVDTFNSAAANPRGAQLIFTTHDVSMLDSTIYGENLLDRDEIWFVEKNHLGESDIYPLTSIKHVAKPEDNFYKKYIQGRYGAIPKVSITNEIISYWGSRQDEKATQ